MGEWLGIVLVPMNPLSEDQALWLGVTTLPSSSELIGEDMCIVIRLDYPFSLVNRYWSLLGHCSSLSLLSPPLEKSPVSVFACTVCLQPICEVLWDLCVVTSL